jgi:acyl-CoA synthetase (AMP-forming)/AMP-acid ligase II
VTGTDVGLRVGTEHENRLYPSYRQRPHTMPGLLARQAAERGEAAAIVAGDGMLTFSAWADQAARVAAVLTDRGVAAGDRVGLWGTNAHGCGWAAALLGIQWAAAVPVPLNSRMPLSANQMKLNRLKARLVITEGGSDRERDWIPMASAVEYHRTVDAPAAGPGQPASVFHTSGTTGPPKAAFISHRSLAYAAAATAEHILAPPCGVTPLSSADVIQTSIPLFTSSGLVHFILMGLWTGCRLVCEPRFDPVDTVACARREGSTIWLTVPSMMLLTAERCGGPHRELPLRVVWHMGSVATAECIAKSHAAFPGAAILNLYSLTETCAGFVVSRADEALAYPGSAGRPTPNTRIRVVGASGEPAASGQPGEIEFASPYMFDGYYDEPQANARLFTADGWLRSGDGGRIDETGLIWVSGRLGDVIVRGGLNINPLSVEQVIARFPGIADVVLTSTPHRVLGEDIVALIVADGPVDVAAMRAHCLQAIADNEFPRRIFFVPELPRNEFGKLNRRAARDMATAMVQGAAASGAAR